MEEIKPLTHEEKEKAAVMGLGMGVDCLSPNHDLLDQQIDPRPSSLLQLTVGSGYRAFKDDVRDWYKINRSMSNNIKTLSGLPVKMDVGVNANRRSESRLVFTCEGEMVHTRTIRFVIGVPTETGTSMMDWSNYEKERIEQDDEATAKRFVSMDNDLQFDASGDLKGDDTVTRQSEPKLTSPTDTSHKAETTVSRSISLRPEYSSQVSRASLQQPEKSRLDILLDSKPQPNKTGKQEDIQEEMIEICKSIIKEENRGVTHFVSSIDLGAKVFYTETVSEKKTSSKFSVTAGIESVDGGASAGVSLYNQSIGRSVKSGTTATIHPKVELKTMKTDVTPNQEKVIGCEVSPVWLLVQDKDWRQAMKHACWAYVYESASRSPFPLISTGGPFVISSGNYFLTVREDAKKGYVLEGTEECQEACFLYIEIPRSTSISSTPDQSKDPLHDPDSGFYIYHTRKKRTGIKMYLCADPEDESTVCLVTRIPSHNAYSHLYVEFPSTQSLAPLSRWAKEPLHLLRKTAYRKRRQYIVMKKADRNNQRMKLFFSSEPHVDGDLQSLCQFTIQNEKCHCETKGTTKVSTQM